MDEIFREIKPTPKWMRKAIEETRKEIAKTFMNAPSIPACWKEESVSGCGEVRCEIGQGPSNA